MRKLGRILRRCLTALSLLLFVAVLAAWVRGYWICEELRMVHSSLDQRTFSLVQVEIRWGGGDVGITRLHCYTAGSNALAKGFELGKGWNGSFERISSNGVCNDHREQARWHQSSGWPTWVWDHAGVVVAELGYASSKFESLVHWSDPKRWTTVAFPCWMAAVVFGGLPSWRFVAWWRSRRRRLAAAREGRCRGCGYDLRASPQRCPECGREVEEGTKARRHVGTKG